MLAVLPCLAASACASTRSVVEAPRLPAVPQSLKQPCDEVSDIPDRDLGTAEVARLWGRDRAALGECRRRHGALAAAAAAIETQGD